MILLLGSFILARASRTEPVPVRESLSGLPMKIGPWQGDDLPAMDQRVLKVLGVDDYLDRVYARPGGPPVALYVGYYRSQRQGDTIHSPLNCMPGAGWNPVRRGFIEIPASARTQAAPDATEGRILSIEVNRIVIQKAIDKQVVLYWYQSHGRVVASEYWGKIYTVLDALRTNRTDAALVRTVSPVRGLDPASEQNSERESIEFVQALFPLLSTYLPK